MSKVSAVLVYLCVIATGASSGNTQTPPKSVAPVTPIGVLTPDDLQRTLQAKGALALKKEEVAEGVRVSCYAPQKANPANLRYLETVGGDARKIGRQSITQIRGATQIVSGLGRSAVPRQRVPEI